VKRYLLDTGVLGDFINHRKKVDVKVREMRRSGARIGTCLPVVGELFFGVEASATRDANLPRLKRALSQIVCRPFDRQAAEQFGRIAAALKRAGRPMQQIDIQIAAIALSLGNTTVASGTATLRPYRV
jgi:tRNA(fMet)-specific endonuclease VapC